MPVDSEYALVVSGDSNPEFVSGLAVTLYSALTHLDRGCAPALYVLDCGLSPNSLRSLAEVAHKARPGIGVQRLAPSQEQLRALSKRSSHPSGKYGRLLLDELLPESVRRVVYLDADVLVRRDLSPLFTLELGQAPMAAAPELIGSLLPDPPQPYFNSGVLVIDVPRWREQRIRERVLDFIEQADHLPTADQDALNSVVSDWQPLDLSWNLQLGGLIKHVPWELPAPWTGRADLQSLHRRLKGGPVIFHFTFRKPWQVSHGPLPSAWLWARCYAQTGQLGRVQSRRWLLNWLWSWGRMSAGSSFQRVRRRAASKIELET